jgi:hypothetical protein
MSFILDALKKLEREKQARDPGVVMVAPVPWGERDRRRRGPGLAVAGAVLAFVVAGSFLWLWSGADPSAARSGDEGPAATPSADGEETAAVAPEPAGRAASETTQTTPTIPGSRTAGPAAAGPAPPPPRDLPPPEDTTPPQALEAPPVFDEAIPAEAGGMASAVSEQPDVMTSEQAAPEDPVDMTEPEAPAVETQPAAGSSRVPEYRLTAISSRDGHPIALLNDRLVREGDSFDGITIIQIGETSVEIEVNGKRRHISF